MTDLVIRALTESDAQLFRTLPDRGLVGRAAFGHSYATVREGGEYRPEWTWIAERDGVVVARAAWWSGPADTAPVTLNWFDFADGEDEAGTELLRQSPLYAEYELILPMRLAGPARRRGRRRGQDRRRPRGRDEAAGRAVPVPVDAGVRAARAARPASPSGRSRTTR